MAHSRVTVSLPPEVASDLDHLSRLMGMSRSAIVSDVLEDAFRSLVPIVEHYAAEFPDGDSPLSRRLRGASAEYIRHAFSELRQEAANTDVRYFELTSPTDQEG